ncbi:MAG: amidohydrolase family protein [Anaerolineales bacterium]|nr:amidohydrolase family protein [Anaerolineales bacterium]MDP6769090.1 amidohydrolase family protein [Anaerolineales bacterium]
MSEIVVINAKGVIKNPDAELLENITLVASDGVIKSISRTEDALILDDVTKTYDFPSSYLMSGLVDTHVHLIMPGDGRPPDQFVQNNNDLDLLLMAQHNAKMALLGGVTTLRDVGSRGQIAFTLRDAIRDCLAVGPRIIASGSPITITGGHCHYLGGEADGVEQVRTRVREILKLGADLVKVMGSGGGTPRTNPWRASFGVSELQAAVLEAHRHNVHITVHASCAEATRFACEAGVDMIEHAAMWTISDSDPKHEFDAGLVDDIVQRGIYVGPTLQASYCEILDLDLLKEQRVLTQVESERLDHKRRLFDNTMETVQRMKAHGVLLVSGTDAGWDYNSFLGGAYIDLELASEVGMSNREIIEFSTRRAAQSVGLGNQIGALEPGYFADLLVVSGNPVDDIGVIQHPEAVFCSGKLRVRDGSIYMSGDLE